MIKDLVSKPYMKLSVDFITKARNFYDELIEQVPELDFKTSISTIDENIIIESTVDGKETKRVYSLKVGKNGSKFDFKHTLKEDDEIDTVRQTAWAQKEAWEYKLNEKQVNKLENAN